MSIQGKVMKLVVVLAALVSTVFAASAAAQDDVTPVACGDTIQSEITVEQEKQELYAEIGRLTTQLSWLKKKAGKLAEER
jgi:peptidoglycan hydrolase CwlO-like protein